MSIEKKIWQNKDHLAWIDEYKKNESRIDQNYLSTVSLGTQIWQKEFIRGIEKTLGSLSGKDILEIGFGTCTFARYLATHCDVKSYLGTEIDSSFLPIFEKQQFPPQFQCMVSTSENLSIDQRECVTVIQGVVHHFYDHVKAFENLLQCSKIMYMFEPNALHPFRRFQEWQQNSDPKLPPERSYTLFQYKKFIQQAAKNTSHKITIKVVSWHLLPSNMFNWRFLSFVPVWVKKVIYTVDGLIAQIPGLNLFSYFYSIVVTVKSTKG